MKKFDRLPPNVRREEIKTAAIELFVKKGFAATTMENVVEKVTLSKGGVYRIYPSTTAILADLMIDGMHLRNEYYVRRVTERTDKNEPVTLEFLTDIIGDSLLTYPEFSAIYAEFLWEKKRNPMLQKVYEKICDQSVNETVELMKKYGVYEMFLKKNISLELMTEFMNTAILGIQVMGLQEHFRENKTILSKVVMETLLQLGKSENDQKKGQMDNEGTQ